MLFLSLKKSSRLVNQSHIKPTSFYSTKKFQNHQFNPGESITIKEDHPMDRVLKCLKRDGALMKKNLTFWKKFENPALDKTGRVLDWENPNAPIFPNHCDILVIGGGVVGSSVAYWCKLLANKSMRVVVVDRDPTYRTGSTVLSVGGLRQQFSLEENIQMSLYGAEFLANINRHLHVEGDPPVDIQFHPYGYLTLSKEETADTLRRNSKLQNSFGAKNTILNRTQLKARFPWLNVDDIELGCLGLEKEGWFDPWSLLFAFKRKAMSMGVEYIAAEAKGFNFNNIPSMIFPNEEPGKYEEIEYLVVETEDGKLRPITFSKCIIAAGAFSANVARMARVGEGKNLLSIPLPIEPRKRYVYNILAPEGPGLNTPMTVDPSGAYFRREGLDNNYVCGICPEEDDEPSVDNLDVDPNFFDEKIRPIIANRVPAFKNLKVKSSRAGYQQYNTFDENGIIGMHSYYDRIFFATGFSAHGVQHAPAIGRAISELIEHGEYKTIDLSRLQFDRFIRQKPMREISNC